MKRERLIYTGATLGFFVVWIFAFFAVGNYAAMLPTRDLTTALDRAIPLVPGFVWLYELCYIFPLVPLFIVRNWHRYNRALLAILLANVTAFGVYLLLPLAFPKPVLGTSLSERLLASIIAADFSPGANKLPSLHVIFSWIVYFLCRGESRKSWVTPAVFITALAISVSTLFVKQHILYDVVGGFIWAVGCWKVAGYLYPRMANTALPAPVALRNMIVRPFVRTPRPARPPQMQPEGAIEK